MRFTLQIDVNNDAFAPELHTKVGRILREAADKVEESSRTLWLFDDVNGNEVGWYAFTEGDC